MVYQRIKEAGNKGEGPGAREAAYGGQNQEPWELSMCGMWACRRLHACMFAY